MASAVMATIQGRSPSGHRSRICRVASSPSISGIWTSDRSRSYGWRSSASIASKPFAATSARYPSFSSNRSASFWFTTLSSARRIRSGCLVARSSSRALAWRSDPSSSVVSSTVATAACSGEALSGLVTTAPMPAPSHLASAVTSCWPTDDASTTGSPASRSWIFVASSRPSMPGISMSSTARSIRPFPTATSASSGPDASTVSTSHAPSIASRSLRFVSLSSTTSARRPRNDPSRLSAVGVISVTPASIVTWNVLPRPGTPSLSTHTVPPMSSARRRLMASPSPVPPYRRLVDASPWLKDWNSRPTLSGGMPMPASRTIRW